MQMYGTPLLSYVVNFMIARYFMMIVHYLMMILHNVMMVLHYVIIIFLYVMTSAAEQWQKVRLACGRSGFDLRLGQTYVFKTGSDISRNMIKLNMLLFSNKSTLNVLLEYMMIFLPIYGRLGSTYIFCLAFDRCLFNCTLSEK